MAKHEQTVTVKRTFEVAPERVFAAWTQAQALARWFGPRGFTVHSCEADARPGGALKLCLRSPDGKDYWVRGTFREVVAPERVVMDVVADDASGKPQLEEVIDVRLKRKGDATELLLRATAAGSTSTARDMIKGMPAGWKQTIDRLDEQLKT